MNFGLSLIISLTLVVACSVLYTLQDNISENNVSVRDFIYY